MDQQQLRELEHAAETVLKAVRELRGQRGEELASRLAENAASCRMLAEVMDEAADAVMDEVA